MNDDQFLEQALLDDKFRPMPGYVICIKDTKNKVLDVEGLGAITISEERESGLVLISNETKLGENYKSLLVTVVCVGREPDAWECRWFKKKRNWNTSFKDQGIDVGTVLGVRAVSGVDQTKGSDFVLLRYDEISVIGQPLDFDGPDMLPAPGWVLVSILDSGIQNHGGLQIKQTIEEIVQHGFMTRGRVVALPRGYSDGEYAVGDIICFPTHTGVGATEFIEFDGGLRALPMDDVLAIEET